MTGRNAVPGSAPSSAADSGTADMDLWHDLQIFRIEEMSRFMLKSDEIYAVIFVHVTDESGYGTERLYRHPAATVDSAITC